MSLDSRPSRSSQHLGAAEGREADTRAPPIPKGSQMGAGASTPVDHRIGRPKPARPPKGGRRKNTVRLRCKALPDLRPPFRGRTAFCRSIPGVFNPALASLTPPGSGSASPHAVTARCETLRPRICGGSLRQIVPAGHSATPSLRGHRPLPRSRRDRRWEPVRRLRSTTGIAVPNQNDPRRVVAERIRSV